MIDDQPAPKPSAAVLAYAWVILVVVYLASVVAPFNQFKVPPIMPILIDNFQITLAQAGSLMSLVAFVGLLLALPAGVILQRLGPKVTAIISMGFIAIGAAMGALAGTFPILMVSRLLEGAGIGLIGVAAPATIAAWFPPERQGMPMGIWATWVPVGTVAMYNLAPLLAASWGWQAVWWAGVIFALVMIVFSALLLKSPPVQGENIPHPAIDLRTLRIALANRDIWLLSLGFACFNFVFVSFSTYYPTFLNELRGYSLGEAGFIASIATMLIIFSAPVAGLLSDWIGSRRLLFTIPYLLIAIILLLPFRLLGWQIIAVMIALGIIVGAIPTATFTAAPELMRKPYLAGVGLAIILVGQYAGQLLGPVFFGYLVEIQGWTTAGDLLIPFCIVALISGWLVRIR
ncbi:MAG: MFS transporter [Anaerolineales bacterium]